jgi:hypothetical protein
MPSNKNRTLKFILTALISLALLCNSALLSRTAHGQALEELKLSEVYQKLDRGLPGVRGAARTRPDKRLEALSNYETLWVASLNAKLLLQWIEIRLPNYQAEVNYSGHSEDHARAEVSFKNRQRTQISVTIQIPKPLYRSMAQHRTLDTFNRYRPPALNVVGEQKVAMHGVQADYFRHAGGACSLLIPIEQMGIVNLYISHCSQSEDMFDVAKLLNVERLNQKLTS